MNQSSENSKSVNFFITLTHFLRSSAASLVLIAMSVWNTPSMAQGVSLLSYSGSNLQGETLLTEGELGTLNRIRARGTHSDVQVVNLDLKALDSDWISVALPNGEIIQITLKTRSTQSNRQSNNFGWSGEIRTKRHGRALFSVTNGEVGGDIWYGSDQYFIGPLGRNHYFIGKLIPSDRELQDIVIHLDEKQSQTNIKNTNSTSDQGALASPQIVKILVTYSEDAKLYFDLSPDGVSSRSIHQLNEALEKSNVAMRVELADTRLTSFYQTGIMLNDLDEVRRSIDIGKIRDEVEADIVVTLVGSHPTRDADKCGVSIFNASAESAFAMVKAEWLGTRNDCFSHEVGHVFGLDHDVAHAGIPPPFSYNHGLQYTPTNSNQKGCFMTIMAYPFRCKDGVTAPALTNSFSNPSVAFDVRDNDGVFLWSAPTGNEEQANNARALSEAAARVANFRPK